jgi:hypothetical protein
VSILARILRIFIQEKDMAEISRTIITELANLEDAVNMSILNGQTQANFTGRAVEKDALPGATATYCLCSGFLDEVLVGGYEADPRFFVSEFTGRTWRLALDEHSPQLRQV